MTLNLNGHTLTIAGTIITATSGSLVGSSTSNITVTGTGAVGALMFSASGNTLGNLTVNAGATGNVQLGNSLVVSGTLSLSGGTLDLNGQDLTVSGTINPTLSGSLTGNALSNLTFNGSGNAGVLLFAAANQSVHSLTINISSSGTVALGSPVTVGGTLTLSQGNINIGKNNLTILASGSLAGGSSTSYVVTSDTGRLIQTVANAGATAAFHIGTLVNYAPVTVTNNSSATGSFSVKAHPGVFAMGTVGTDLSTTTSVVNTSWDVASSIVAGANVDLKMQWNASMQVHSFDNTQAYISHYTGGAWNTHALAAATAMGSGNYSLALTGVTSFSPFAAFDHNTSTSIEAVSANDMIKIFPIPSTGTLTITGIAVEKTNVEISDVNGKLVGIYILSNGENTIPVANLSIGSYFIKLSNSQMSTIKKFVKM